MATESKGVGGEAEADDLTVATLLLTRKARELHENWLVEIRSKAIHSPSRETPTGFDELSRLRLRRGTHIPESFGEFNLLFTSNIMKHPLMRIEALLTLATFLHILCGREGCKAKGDKYIIRPSFEMALSQELHGSTIPKRQSETLRISIWS